MAATDLDYVHIVQRLGVTVGDGADTDEFPDFVPVTEGTVAFVPTLENAKVVVDGGPVSVFNAAIVATIDPEGYLSYNGVRGVWLVDLGSDKIVPPVPRDKAAYTVIYSGLKFGGRAFGQKNVPINPVSGTEFDLTNATALPLPAGVTLEYMQGVADRAVAAAESITGLRGVAGGFAALNADGDVVDANGEVVTGEPTIDASALTEGTLASARLPAIPDAKLPNSVKTTTDTRPVGKGELVFNVKDYGAVGDGISDDTPAINAALAATAASAAFGARVFFPGCTVGYRTTSGITTPDHVDVDMAEAIIYDGPAGVTALTVGSSTRTNNRTHRLRVRSTVISDWSDESYVGIKIINHYYSRINIAEARGFTIGAQLFGDSNGYVYNGHVLGMILDNKVGLDLTNAGTGWCNENEFYGGSFSCGSSTNVTLDRIGVRFNSATNYYNNSNKFYGPSFEIKGGIPAQSFEGLCVEARFGSYNHFKDVRHESPDATALRQLNSSTDNTFDVAFNINAIVPVEDNAGVFASATVNAATTRKLRENNRLVYKADALHKRACYYDGATQVNVPGLTAGSSSTPITDARALNAYVINPSYVEIPGPRMLGFYMSTRMMKSFMLEADAEDGYGGRFVIRCHDSFGAVVSTESAARSNVSNPTYATSFGGAFRSGSDSNTPRYFQVGPAVDYVFVAVSGGSTPARIRALAAFTSETTVGAVWLAHANDIPGANYGTTAPTAGTWDAGRRVHNATPAAGGVEGWVCVLGGTPGTWKSFGAIAS